MAVLSSEKSLPPAPAWRVRAVRDVPPRGDGAYVLYWMIGARRLTSNFALDRALAWADALRVPLVVLEGLRCDYRWASDRFHQFVLDGMRDNAEAAARAKLTYFPYLEPELRAGRGLLETLARAAAVVITDRTPVFDLPGLVRAAAARVQTRFEEVDGYGIVPVDAPAAVFPTAYVFRRYLQRALPEFLGVRPQPSVVPERDRRLPGGIPTTVLERWPAAELSTDAGAAAWTRLPIDHRVGVVGQRGGARAATETCERFLRERLNRYIDDRAHPDDDVGSDLSPYLHFGHISPHDVLWSVLDHDGWTPERLASTVTGAKAGWWGASPAAEAFLDQLVTWRELGGNAARHDDYTRYEALPAWAQATLDRHAADPRPFRYDLDTFASATTHDPLWNAAQRQLSNEGRLHNYMRMLWGKKILEWTASPREALEVMVELNNRYALDGRDPNSYSGIFWVLGRYDRPWGPERPIFGTVRYMTSDSAARKLRLKRYLERYGPSRLF